MAASLSKLTFSLFLTVGFFSFAYSQTGQYEIDFSKTDDFTVTGTSTLTDWTVNVPKIGGQPAVLTGLDDSETVIESFYFFASVNDMEGGRGTAMDDKIKAALNSTEHPLIEYRQTQPATVKPNVTGNAVLGISSIGNLIMAGVSKPIELELLGRKEENGNLILQGQKELKFSEFGMEPPSAMFGQIVCGDEIQINIVLHLKPITQN